jgi:hypothetical protein
MVHLLVFDRGERQVSAVVTGLVEGQGRGVREESPAEEWMPCSGMLKVPNLLSATAIDHRSSVQYGQNSAPM